MNEEKYVDESWKETVAKDKEGQTPPPDLSSAANQNKEEPSAEGAELDFLSYISSLAFQAMIFLGKLPNPVTNQVEQNLRQAKLIIDTLLLLREKTAGNLNQQENDMLNSALYELQMTYVEALNQEGKP